MGRSCSRSSIVAGTVGSTNNWNFMGRAPSGSPRDRGGGGGGDRRGGGRAGRRCRAGARRDRGRGGGPAGVAGPARRVGPSSLARGRGVPSRLAPVERRGGRRCRTVV